MLLLGCCYYFVVAAPGAVVLKELNLDSTRRQLTAGAGLGADYLFACLRMTTILLLLDLDHCCCYYLCCSYGSLVKVGVAGGDCYHYYFCYNYCYAVDFRRLPLESLLDLLSDQLMDAN